MTARIPLKFGLHEFINAQPLLQPLRDAAPQAGVEVVCDVPARLADRLAAGEMDLAMIPSIEFLKAADHYRLLPAWAIASRGPVDTVLLVRRMPLEDVRTVAVDERSRTSATLLRLLFRDRLHASVRYDACAVTPASLDAYDAAMVIGDQAFGWPDGLGRHDLSEEWLQVTGHAFVHAVVAVRPGLILPDGLAARMEAMKARGRARIAEIAESQARLTGLAPERVRDYLEHRIIYDLGEEELAGLRAFQAMAVAGGFLEHLHPIRFAGG